MREDRLKHLEFIQAIIARMAANSFVIKGWSVTLVAALFALAAKDSNAKFGVIALIPLVIFWILDGYYISRERAFRNLFKTVVQLSPGDEVNFAMEPQISDEWRSTWVGGILSATLLVFHGTLAMLIVVVLFSLNSIS